MINVGKEIKMEKKKEFIVFCHFSAIGKKIVKASSIEEAKQIAKSDDSVKFDEIIRLTRPCKVDEVLLFKSKDQVADDREIVEYKNWGSE
jgi:hypothetical protein